VIPKPDLFFFLDFCELKRDFCLSCNHPTVIRLLDVGEGRLLGPKIRLLSHQLGLEYNQTWIGIRDRLYIRESF